MSTFRYREARVSFGSQILTEVLQGINSAAIENQVQMSIEDNLEDIVKAMNVSGINRFLFEMVFWSSKSHIKVYFLEGNRMRPIGISENINDTILLDIGERIKRGVLSPGKPPDHIRDRGRDLFAVLERKGNEFSISYLKAETVRAEAREKLSDIGILGAKKAEIRAKHIDAISKNITKRIEGFEKDIEHERLLKSLQEKQEAWNRVNSDLRSALESASKASNAALIFRNISQSLSLASAIATLSSELSKPDDLDLIKSSESMDALSENLIKLNKLYKMEIDQHQDRLEIYNLDKNKIEWQYIKYISGQGIPVNLFQGL